MKIIAQTKVILKDTYCSSAFLGDIRPNFLVLYSSGYLIIPMSPPKFTFFSEIQKKFDICSLLSISSLQNFSRISGNGKQLLQTILTLVLEWKGKRIGCGGNVRVYVVHTYMVLVMNLLESGEHLQSPSRTDTTPPAPPIICTRFELTLARIWQPPPPGGGGGGVGGWGGLPWN